MLNKLTLSIIIPVYNEEDYLVACLDSIASQTVKPKEVIVVDNNSTDKSIEIAKSYPFVTLLREKRQGQVFAQAKGFEHANSDIIGRIDADSILPINWVKNILKKFSGEDNIVALVGDGDPYDAPLKVLASAVFRFYHSFLSKIFSGHVMLWGANMAFRRSAWHRIAKKMTYQTDVWEDYEMSFLLAGIGKIDHLNNIKIGCSFRAAHRPLLPQLSYQFRAVRTFLKYKGLIRAILFFCAWYTMVLLFVPMAINRFIWKITNSRTSSHR